MVSNTAIRSSKTIEIQPWSEARTKSFVIVISTASVLQWGLNPD